MHPRTAGQVRGHQQIHVHRRPLVARAMQTQLPLACAAPHPQQTGLVTVEGDMSSAWAAAENSPSLTTRRKTGIDKRRSMSTPNFSFTSYYKYGKTELLQLIVIFQKKV